MAELRAFCYLDRLQPQFASLFASACRGFLSVEGMASLFVEVVPGVEINRLSDIALKITNSRPGEMIVERRYGMLEIHSFEQGEVQHAGSMILDELGLKEEERLAPSVLATSIINKIDPYQAVIINRNSKGMLILGGDDVYLLEVTPAAYSSIAANEAEKHCDVRLVDIRFFGASGRIYMAGTESEIQAAAQKVVETLGKIKGRTP
jgi:ethanolamine utilization microcompartment shell protein EutS